MTIVQLNQYIIKHNRRPDQTKAKIKELPVILQPQEELKAILEGML